MDLIFSRVRNFDKNHWLMLTPIIFPLTGMYFGISPVFKVRGAKKLVPIALLFINFCLAVVIFVSYAFSYWQF
jgi:hypothetical protein